jgi:hypothetical protein
MRQILQAHDGNLVFERIRSVVAELPSLQPDGSFHFTSQHLRLLHQLRLEWPNSRITWIVAGGGYPAPVVNFKHPFGDMTAFEIDMATILGLRRQTGDQFDPALERFYWEIWPALQAFVEQVRIDAATSCTGK